VEYFLSRQNRIIFTEFITGPEEKKTMKHIKTLIFILTMCSVISCGSETGWQKVEYDNDIRNGTFMPECVTDHQGEHILSRCNIYLEKVTIYIVFPAELPAYWGSMTIRIHGDKFESRFSGIPFDAGEVSFETVKEQLVLPKPGYILGDTLSGRCDLFFRQTDKRTGSNRDFYFKGRIAGIIRYKDFNPFNEVNFMGFDPAAAAYELGEPKYSETFDTRSLPEFRVELLNYLPADENVLVKELTWDISETRDLSDEGKERLTIWYTEKDGMWKPVHFMKWNEDSQF